MKIKTLTVLLALIIGMTGAFAADKAAAGIEFAQKSHDFGMIKEDGGPVRVEFEFTNTGTAPLVIISATASCGCTRPTFSPDPIKPGKKGWVRVAYHPMGRPGEFDKTIKVRTNAPAAKTVKLRIRGNVIPAPKKAKK